MARLVTVTLLLLIAACTDAPTMPAKNVPAPADWRLVEMGNISFRFPQDIRLSGHDDLCGRARAPQGPCVLFDEGPVLSAARGTFGLQSRDDFGDTGPAAGQLGNAVLINGRQVHRSKSGDGTVTYVVAAGSGGSDAAPLLWLRPDDALLWMRCSEPRDCLVAEQVAGSVAFESARQACQRMQAARRSTGVKLGQAPAPPGAKCRRWLGRLPWS